MAASLVFMQWGLHKSDEREIFFWINCRQTGKYILTLLTGFVNLNSKLYNLLRLMQDSLEAHVQNLSRMNGRCEGYQVSWHLFQSCSWAGLGITLGNPAQMFFMCHYESMANLHVWRSGLLIHTEKGPWPKSIW